ncbi:C45 family autoproteolytic acyltransferase/hydolase [Nonomuraea cavernae]|uniref:Acyl-CoA--6-aminopenicillanic acid acyl-transferase n=1 Tax=Nonomuraea cavernae TaxID=2045107 RepID=A0A917Z9N8_9ACTN|nr:C45 family peptidase [Nonomuraea cavernae]MCA2187175.1 C45 family peptidase [Nonomuraea cavernae]GGO79045.1 acyl-CoA--6-aminopenicillanic acid acyl-transferase [Nonomuraea cavernae]
MPEPRRYPRIRVSGGPYERGRLYGDAARDRVHRGRAGYEAAFARAAGWSWEQAVEAAAPLEAAIAAVFPAYVEEMRGIADGAQLAFADVLTMNARTEVMWAATARQAASMRAAHARECSSFALLPGRTADRHTMVGQNWDWLVHSFETVVVLEVEQDDAPNYVTVVEAGLLAKTSMNSSGLAIATNALVTSADRGAPGLPYHVVLRALADCHTLTDAVNVVQRHWRSSSANYLLAHQDGTAINLETAPGDHSQVYPLLPVGGGLVHTNHFLAPLREVTDVSLYAMADSLVRLQRVQAAIAETGRPATVDSLREALSDHADHPYSVCCHPDVRAAPDERSATVMSVIMDLDERTIWLSDGNPCRHPHRPLTFDGLLDKPSPLLAR